MDELAGGLKISIVSTMITIGVLGNISPPLDIGIKLSLSGIGNILKSIILRNSKKKPKYHIKIEHEYVIITADVPGVPKKNIDIISTENSVSINAAYKDRTYSVDLHFKERIDPYSIQKKYFTGVLVLRYKRIKPPKSILTAI